MPQQARVTSLDALQAFRSNLIVYLSQARPALEEVSADVLRTRVWLENDQHLHWENQMRRRAKELEQAQQALFSAKISNLRHENALEQLAVQRARRAVEEADIKLRTLKKWAREYDSRLQPMVKQVEKLQTLFTIDMVKALTYLAEALNTLAAYADIKAPEAPASPSATAPAAPAGEPEPSP